MFDYYFSKEQIETAPVQAVINVLLLLQTPVKQVAQLRKDYMADF